MFTTVPTPKVTVRSARTIRYSRATLTGYRRFARRSARGCTGEAVWITEVRVAELLSLTRPNFQGQADYVHTLEDSVLKLFGYCSDSAHNGSHISKGINN